MAASFSLVTQINSASLGNSDAYWDTPMPFMSWGPQQPRMIRHDDNAQNFPTLRVLYPCYPTSLTNQPQGGADTDGADINFGWKIMRRPSGYTGSFVLPAWVVEASGISQCDMFLLRDPVSDVAILITFPNSVPTVYTSVNSFTVGTVIPGSWQINPSSTTRKYSSAAISPITGLIVFKASVGLTSDHNFTADTATDYITGTYNATTGVVDWNTKVRKVIGQRHAYDCLFPDPHPEMIGIYGVARRDVFRTLSPYGIFDQGLGNNYIFEGHKVYKTGATNSRSWSEIETALDNPAVPGTAPDQIARFEMGHSHITKDGYILVMDFLTNDGTSGFSYMARGFYLTVYDRNLNKVQDRVLQTNMAIGGLYFGDGKFIEDSYGRLYFLLASHGASIATIKLYTISKSGTQFTVNSSPTDLSTSGLRISGTDYAPLSLAMRIAEPKGGNMRPRGVATGESPNYQVKVDVCFMCRNTAYGGTYPSAVTNMAKGRTYPAGFPNDGGTVAGNDGRIIYAQLTL